MDIDDGRPPAGVLRERGHLSWVLSGGDDRAGDVRVGGVDCKLQKHVRVNRPDDWLVAAVDRGDGVKLRVGGDDDALEALQHLLDLGSLGHGEDGERDVSHALLRGVALVVGVAVESLWGVVQIGG